MLNENVTARSAPDMQRVLMRNVHNAIAVKNGHTSTI